MTAPSVTCELAWAWTCPTCCERNYAESAPAQPDDDTKRGLLGLEPWQEIPEDDDQESYVTQPAEVACAVCGGRFEVEGEDSDQ